MSVQNFPQNNVIFIHIPKTAGASVYSILNLIFGHKTAFEVRDTVGLWYWKRAVKFSIIRHPCDRLQSLYYFTRDMKPEHPWYESMVGQRAFLSQYESLEDLILRIDHDVFCNEFFRPMSYWLNVDGRCAVDFLLRFEKLSQDWGVFAHYAGLPLQLPQVNQSEHPPWQEGFTPLMLCRLRSLLGDEALEYGYHL